jgi:50S ribosomal subunit-associated GTPase HflX
MIYLFNKIDISLNNKENCDNIDDNFLNKYTDHVDDYLLVSAYNGKGIDEIIAILEKVEKIEKK